MRLKKILSIALVFAMLFSMVCVPTFAEETYTWEIDQNGTLTITGTGAIDIGPWKDNVNSITSIVVNEGITSFGRGTFKGLKYVTRISLPKSLKSIGYEAFAGCTHLQSITFPEALEVIGTEAFSNCTALAEVTIPASVISIENGAFSGCTHLKKAVFLNSPTILTPLIFSGCTSLEDVTLPMSLARIGSYCFTNCTSLKKIVLPDTVTALGSDTFSGCTSLEEINTENILEYGSKSFSGCSSLDTIEINKTVKTIPERMFDNSGITHLVLPENLQTIAYYAFSGCTKLETVNIPEKLTRLDGGTFNGCTSLREFSMPKSITTIDNSFFKDCTSLSKVTLHDNVTRIGFEAFENCTSLKSIILPKNLKTLYYNVFKNTGITEITIPNCLDTIYDSQSSFLDGDGPFGGSNLETVYFEAGRTEIPNNLFKGATKLQNVDLSNIEKIGNGAFAGCSEFVPVLGDKISEIGSYAFANCTAIEDFEYPVWMEKIPNGLLMGTSIGYVVFPETVKEIGAYAYNGCTNLSYIGFSDTITDIGNYAFSGCTALYEIDIPGTVINIGNRAFEQCSNLKMLTMHKGTQTIGIGAFADCNLTEVRPSQTIRNLNDEMFNGNPVQILVVPRFCKTWNGWANYYNNFNPAISYVSANVENFDIYTYEKAIIKGVEGTAGEAEANREGTVVFEPITTKLDELSFDKNTVDISLDETYDAAAIVTAIPGYVTIVNPENSLETITVRDEMDGEFITFTSDNESVATVDSTGYVHGVGYGTANITISCDSGITDVLTVNVVRPLVGISISSGYEEMNVGETVTLTADTIPPGEEENYIWSSSDEEIATVTQEGVIEAIKEGTVIISVKGEYSGKTAKCVVKVTNENESPYQINIDSFIVGCDVSLSGDEIGGNVIGALYDSSSRLLDTNIYPASEKVRVDFNVLPTVDLKNAQIKVFWWDAEMIKPISNFRLIGIE